MTKLKENNTENYLLESGERGENWTFSKKVQKQQQTVNHQIFWILRVQLIR